MAENERDFKGVWIPRTVWLDERLNALDKVILTEIDSLDNGERGCFASNRHIAEFCQCSETKVSTAISKLIKLGYIYVQKFDGRQRELKSRLSNFERQNFENCKADFKNLKESNTNNNTVINTDKNNNNAETEFAALWELYPRKQGKTKAFNAYKKALKKGVTFETIKQGIEAYRKQIEANKTEMTYIKHGSSWFNGECWNDEYTGGNSKPVSKFELKGGVNL